MGDPVESESVVAETEMENMVVRGKEAKMESKEV